VSGARRKPIKLAFAAVLLSVLPLTASSSGATGRTGEVSAPAAVRLAYSTASNFVVQRQPAPGSCHAIGSGLYSRPDRRCTPGALNPQVTQATIGSTICRHGWTSTVRPPERITESEKRASMAAYGDHRPLSDYEYDHFVPLELGGATNDPRNLWPEPGGSPNPKDTVEDELNRKVCDGQMTLVHAQRAIAADWVALAPGRTTTPPHPPGQPKPPSTPAANCSATAQYSSRYNDYDVYVHSNQPDKTVTVTSSGGQSASWHTNSSGYADVFLHAGPSAAGEGITVRVGAATCSTTL
jgi:hypothetical protein